MYEPSPPSSEHPKRVPSSHGRARWQFSLREMLLATAVAACLFAGIGSKLRADRGRARAAEVRNRLDLARIAVDVISVDGPIRAVQAGSGMRGNDSYSEDSHTTFAMARATEFPTDALDRLRSATVARLTQLGATIERTDRLDGDPIANRPPVYPAVCGVQVLYRYGPVRGTVVFRLTEFDMGAWVDRERYIAYVWAYHGQFH